MELEFDKEIDAILRKTRGGAVTSVTAGHLDADTIAAFAENALPASGRVLYTEHFADCGRCRKQLSHAIAMNREAVATAASPPWPPVEKALSATAPWYAKLFQVRNLAMAMGALVLVFSGVLGFMVLKRQNEAAANNAIVSQATEPDAGRGPYYGESAPANANTATAANTNAPPQNAAVPGTIGSGSNTPTSVATGEAGKAKVAEERSLDDRKAFVLDGVTAGAEPPSKPAAAAPPPPADQPKTEGYRSNEDKLAAGRDEKEKDLAVTASREKSRSRMDRDAQPEALKNAGPTRSGPLQKQSNQVNTQSYEMSVTRSVGGKTFANRNGAWYDTIYSGQSVKMVRRGSDDFKKLDGGLRNIANELYGTVIVVWKGKAYRIQ